jgi:hypothetical protein
MTLFAPYSCTASSMWMMYSAFASALEQLCARRAGPCLRSLCLAVEESCQRRDCEVQWDLVSDRVSAGCALPTDHRCRHHCARLTHSRSRFAAPRRDTSAASSAAPSAEWLFRRRPSPPTWRQLAWRRTMHGIVSAERAYVQPGMMTGEERARTTVLALARRGGAGQSAICYQ